MTLSRANTTSSPALSLPPDPYEGRLNYPFLLEKGEGGVSDAGLQVALCASCFENRCPTPPEWAKFVIVGAVMEACGRHHLAPTTLTNPNRLSRLLWEETWDALLEHPFQESTRTALLRLLFPRVERQPREFPELVTPFEQRWKDSCYPFTTMHSVDQLKDWVKSRGTYFLNAMDSRTRDDVVLIAQKSAPVLETTLAYMRDHYLW